MKLFQYWDTPLPPPEIARWVDGFRLHNSEFEHVLLNEATADDFIARHYGQREVRAFRACAVPAMQADFIRLCVIDTMVGIYVDADNQSLRPLAELIARAPHALTTTWLGQLSNSFLMFRRPHNPFIRACLALVLENIERRRFKSTFSATGPAVFCALQVVIDPLCTEKTLRAFGIATPEPLLAFNSEAIADSVKVSPESGPGQASHERHWMTCKAEFLELLQHARSLLAPTPELIAAFNCVTIVDTFEASPWIGSDQPAYKRGDRHWFNWKGDIYRSMTPACGPS